MKDEEPHWASKTDAWGKPMGRYASHGLRGWECHHCGGMFRGLQTLLDHQKSVLGQEKTVTVTERGD